MANRDIAPMTIRLRNLVKRFWLVCLFVASGAGAQIPYVNWENHPVHPMDISPDGQMLAITHTADNRLQLFDVSQGTPIAIGHVVVGIDPVSVRFRTNNEAWVVNHISDSVSIVDIAERKVRATIKTLDEPFDVVFAGTPQRGYVSCSQANVIQAFLPGALNDPLEIAIDAEDPRALAVSNDGSTVYAAIFESGNSTTVLAGATQFGEYPPNITRRTFTPYGGQNPPPNAGESFEPAINSELRSPPRVALIVRKNDSNRWMDDNGGDWTEWVSGPNAPESGRVVGWDIADRDIAIINTSDHTVSYATRLMTMGMAIAVNPATDNVVLVGTEALNEIRFEPNVNGIFTRVQLAEVNASELADTTVGDLNPHLDYASRTIPQAQRNLSVADPRGVLWTAGGERGFVAGMGSNNVVVLGPDGLRLANQNPIEVGKGPIGLALSEVAERLYVWNHFEASISVIGLDSLNELERVSLFSPVPESIQTGRKHFYSSHDTSGLGQMSCASCHVDGRTDRLAWDLGDPSIEAKDFNQNCISQNVQSCGQDFHPMKGPMTTQTLQDIIGKEPFHWRGDRDGLEEFNPAFEGLMGDDEQLTTNEMRQFKNFLATITFPPNPFRNLDNSLPTNLPLPDEVTSQRFGSAGMALPNGNAVAGLQMFREDLLDLLPVALNPDAAANCSTCHSLPTGMAVNGPIFDPQDPTFQNGGFRIADGPNGENHLGLVANGTVNNQVMKIPQLRALYDKTGFTMHESPSNVGFGFLHDGTLDTLSEFVALDEFGTRNNQEAADMIAFLLAFSGSDLPTEDVSYQVATPESQDSHAAVGAQETLAAGANARANNLVNLANSGVIDLVAHAAGAKRTRGWTYASSQSQFVPDDGSSALSLSNLLDAEDQVTLTAVPAGLGIRLGNDRDGDGVLDGQELAQGSNPTDSQSQSFSPNQGLWWNPARSGHGMDLQRSGERLFALWYTYNADGSPTWYFASEVFDAAARTWAADLQKFTWDPAAGSTTSEVVGSVSLEFESASQAQFNWTLGPDSGSEPWERFVFSADDTVLNYLGSWYNVAEPGYGFTIDTMGNAQVILAYFYDANNEPRWVLGNGVNETSTEFTMKSFTGFCPSCETTATANVDAGVVSTTFTAQRSATVNMNVFFPELADSNWARDNITIAPLNDPFIDFSTF